MRRAPGALALVMALTMSGALLACGLALGDPVPADPADPETGTQRPGELAPDTLGLPPPAPSSVAQAGLPGGPRRGPLDGLTIRDVEIETLNIYDPVPSGKLAFFYRLANRMHVRTRSSTVRSQLLFGPGDVWNAARGQEQARNLRALDFLQPVRVTPVRTGDSVKVLVVTRDLWTTSPEFGYQSSGGKRYGSVAFSEDNLAGLGKSLSFTWGHDPVGTSRLFSYLDPDVYGTHGRFSMVTGTGAGGVTSQLDLQLPFWALDASRSYGISWEHTTSDAVLYETGSEVARINRWIEQANLWWGMGSERDSLVRRITFALRFRDRRFSRTIPTGNMPVPPEFLGGEESERLRRFEVEGRLWRPYYIERESVEQMGVIEDFDVGTSLDLTLGDSPAWLGAQDEGYAAARFQQGASTRLGFGNLDAEASSRLQGTAKELTTRVDARWTHQSFGRQTAVFAVRHATGQDVLRDFQLVVGGLNGLRAYPVEAVAGRRLVRLNVEDRWRIGDLAGGLFSLGAVGFADAARAHGPGSGPGDDTGWFVDGGFGLRFTIPEWTLGRVLRLDLAWPLQPTRDGRRQPVFSVGSSQAF